MSSIAPTARDRPLRINIVSSGRFHLLDLARELTALGDDVRFYSCVPKRRALRFGLPASSHRSDLVWMAPLLLVVARGPRPLRPLLGSWFQRLLDEHVARLMPPADAFIGLSGLCVASAAAAREAGATVFIERGSRHILSQRDILAALGNARDIPDNDVEHEIESYRRADVIVVPSRHARESFLERGVQPGSLFVNPYGVDLEMFPPTPKPANREPVVLMVGTWSLQKGCDLLWRACEAAGAWRLFHVGAVGDLPLPRSERFVHHPPVPQWDLARHFARADVLGLPSRQDGFGLVITQALACGVPVVASDRTGAEDIRQSIGDDRWITVVRHGDLASLQAGIARALEQARAQEGRRDILGARRDLLSWKTYGARYRAELRRRCSR